MRIFASVILGYLIGCISPAAMLSKWKHVNLKQEGTKNLGATNTAFVLGYGAGFAVLAADILKSVISAKLAKLLFPKVVCVGMAACIGCILGHCYPVFMGFQGGKGVAVLAGMVLEYRFWFALPIVIPGLILITVLNTGVAAPVWASILFPILVAIDGGSVPEICLALVAGCIIIWTHRDNLKRAFAKEDVVTVREFFHKSHS